MISLTSSFGRGGMIVQLYFGKYENILLKKEFGAQI